MRNKKGQFLKGTHWRKEKPWWNSEWLFDQYIECGKSASQIALENGITENGILYWLGKHNIKRRTISEIRHKKVWGSAGADNPMWNRTGELNPNWKGGITSERQLFYQSKEWKSACSYVWRRDSAICQRCGGYRDDFPDVPFHIHHIISFSNSNLRVDPDNLVLLCEVCHHFVHSKENVNNEFLSKE